MSGYHVNVLNGGKTAEIFLYSEIGRTWIANGVTAAEFVDDLKKIGRVDQINLRINSPGGDVADGLTIYNNLRRHPARVVVDIDGFALSIASIVAMAGDQITMAKNATMMIHDPWGMAMGDASEMRRYADLLDMQKGQLVQTYADRIDRSPEDISKLMAAETWMTAAEAFDQGFVDDISGELAMAASFDPSRFKFKNVPKRLRNLAAVEPAPRMAIATALIERMQQGLRDHVARAAG